MPPSPAPVRVALVGLGFMAATHLKAYRQVPGARIVSLCNPSGRHLDGDFSGVTGNVGSQEPVRLDMTGVKAYREYAQLLADGEVDLVDICAPTHAHVGLAVAALEAGKHVLCEKPLARNSVDAQAIVQAASRARGYFMPAMCLRFWPEWAWLQEAIASNRYGRVLSARFRRMAEPPAWGQKTFLNGALSGGALLDLHIHDTDFVQFCFGQPLAVSSQGYSQLSGAIDHVVTQYRVKSQAIVHAEGGWTMTPGFGFQMQYTVHFERATADYDLGRNEEALRLFEANQPARTVTCEKSDGYIRELQYLVDCITRQRPPALVTARDGLASVRICEAEEQSVLTGQPVFL